MKFDKLILATNNEHKISEMSQLLDGCNIEILTKADFDDFPDVEETGETLTENALLKSRAIYEKYKITAVADDTGLEIDYLNGAPGVYSARFAGENCSFEDNNRKLIELLDGVEESKRTAKFITVIAVSYGAKDHCVEGVVEGSILSTNRGSNGFGYDPVFYYPELKKTFAEMSAEEKNSISHRGRALRKLRDWLSS